MNDVSNTPQSYLDFAGLGGLKGEARQKTDRATRDTATQFEAMFIQMMLKSMREATEKSDLMGNDSATETFEQMYDKELSVQLAKRNTMGVADMLVKHIDRDKAAADASKNFSSAKKEPMPLKPEQTGLALPQAQSAVPLVRPEKFTFKAPDTSRIVPAADLPGADR